MAELKKETKFPRHITDEGPPLTQDELKELLVDRNKGQKSYTLEEAKKLLAKWRKDSK